MSAGLIVLIVVVALIVIGLVFLMPRMRAKAEERKAARELESRRERVATEHREAASTRSTRAERAEQEAAVAQQNAQRERAEAERLEQEAQMHERGLADDKLIEDHERDRFDGVATDTRTDAETDTAGRTGRTGTDADSETAGTTRADTPDTEYEQGREDERDARFRRTEEPAAESETETRR